MVFRNGFYFIKALTVRPRKPSSFCIFFVFKFDWISRDSGYREISIIPRCSHCPQHPPLPSQHWQIELPAQLLSYTIFFSLKVPSPYKVKTIVLLHNGGFCNACITKRCFCITQQMCQIMTLFRHCFVIKDFKKSNVFSYFFLIIFGFLWKGSM